MISRSKCKKNLYVSGSSRYLLGLPFSKGLCVVSAGLGNQLCITTIESYFTACSLLAECIFITLIFFRGKISYIFI